MESKDTYSRRSVLKKAATVGFFPSVKIGSSKDDTVRLPELRDRSGVVKWMEVPEVWVEHKEHAKEVKSRLTERLSHRSGVAYFSLTAAPERYGGKRGFQIKIGIANGYSPEIPDHADGIPVQTAEAERPVPLCYNGSYDAVKGGQKISDTSNPGSWGTTGWKAYDSSCSDNVILTANHAVSDGNTVYGDESGGSFEQIGTVSQRHPDGDVVSVQTNRAIKNEIEGENDTYSIGGWVTEDGMDSRASDLWDGYRKMGATTGETTGGIIEIHLDDGFHSNTPSWWGHGVRGGADIAKGDSGSPSFSLHNSEAYLTHMNTQGYKEKNTNNCAGVQRYENGVGPATYKVNDFHWAIGQARE